MPVIVKKVTLVSPSVCGLGPSQAPLGLFLVSHATPQPGGTASPSLSPLCTLISWLCACRCGIAGWGQGLVQEAGLLLAAGERILWTAPSAATQTVGLLGVSVLPFNIY